MDTKKNEVVVMRECMYLIRNMKEINKETIEEIKQLSNETKEKLMIELINNHNYQTTKNNIDY